MEQDAKQSAGNGDWAAIGRHRSGARFRGSVA